MKTSDTDFSAMREDKFEQSRRRKDRIARKIISAGGYMIIISILAILAFLVYETVPLFRGESVKKHDVSDEPHFTAPTVLAGVDQYQELYYLLDKAGKIRYGYLKNASRLPADSLGLAPDEHIILAVKGNLQKETFSVVTNKNRFLTAEIRLKPVYSGHTRKITAEFNLLDEWKTEDGDAAKIPSVKRLAFSQNDDGLLTYVWVDSAGKVWLRRLDPDFGENTVVAIPLPAGAADISAITIDPDGENLALGTAGGSLLWFDISDAEAIELKDRLQVGGAPITAVAYLIGGGTLIAGTRQGDLFSFFPVRTRGNLFKLTRIHSFLPMRAAITSIFASPRSRLFLAMDGKGAAQLGFSTSGKTELKFTASKFPLIALDIAPKSDGILAVDKRNRVGFWSLRIAHPEATLKTLFGKVWYEGYPGPQFVWQSTGGSDSFEPKLSIVPLIFGTLKGTLYAMIFSIPLAILAAIYVSQFAPQKLARVVKPIVEIMAALPSVVIGMLAGLYFSPLLEKNLMTAFMLLTVSPVVFAVGAFFWWKIARKIQGGPFAGSELLFALLIGILSFFLALWLKTPVENFLFGGNIQSWLHHALGLTYDTRNSIVVGFALGFAVVPIIFTMAEDALSNVPASLKSAALALGASKWQTVRKVVLPAAGAGIFAGVMLGLGRAIGETMIVLMATGNTPLLDWSPFNGFRAMSANIAVEIPEAPVGGTLYHVLFLTALLLFAFTFILNTVSSIVGERLRKKYARF